MKIVVVDKVVKKPRRGVLAPDAEMWSALKGGVGLEEILQDFYTRVYADPRLNFFFEGTTKQRAIEKQFSFLKSIFTGERVYFGEHPKNAHHWMVISDELFDYRENLMVSCLQRYGLEPHLIEKWRALEEVFRRAIVKDKACPRRIGSFERPTEGFERLTLEFSSLCDGCQRELSAGSQIEYHVRTGKAYCETCRPEIEEQRQIATNM